MNIKLQSDLQRDLLLKQCYHTIEFGNPTGNDKDYLHIVKPNVQMDAALHNRDHFLFYKDEKDKVDHLFATPRMIASSIITGSSDLPYLLFTRGLFNHVKYLEPLHTGRTKSFMTYKVVKCLTGCAERDLKQSKSHLYPNKKLFWADKYYQMAVDIVVKHSDELENENISACTIDNIRKVRKIAHQVVPRALSVDVANSLYHRCKDDIDDLRTLDFVSELYYSQWKESL